jgi:uncharacterized membrane protein YgcG
MFIFSLSVIGTAVTALRLRKFVELHPTYSHEPGNGHWPVVAAHVLLLSEIECSIILVCANLPALAAWLNHCSNASPNDAATAAAAARRAHATAFPFSGLSRFLCRACRPHRRIIAMAADGGAKSSGDSDGGSSGGVSSGSGGGGGGGRDSDDSDAASSSGAAEDNRRL